MESKTAFEVPFLLRWGCAKELNQGQILTKIAGIIRFYHPQTQKVFLRYFDGLDHNYGSIYLFSRAKFFGKFLLHNRKTCSADVAKTRIRQNL